jgi:peptidoglycan hydrolase CwlO-like protein
MEGEHRRSTESLSTAAAAVVTAVEPLGANLGLVVTQATDLQRQLQQSTDLLLRTHQAVAQVLTDLANMAKELTAVIRSSAGLPHATA